MKILAIQLRRIGDVLVTTPALAALRQRYPEAEIAYLTEAPSHLVLQGNPAVDKVLLYPKGASAWAHGRMALALRRMRFDCVIDFFSNPRSAQLAWASGAPRRIGFDFPGRRWAYTQRITQPPGRQYAASHKLLLTAALGADTASQLPRFFLDDEARHYAEKQLEELGVSPSELLVALSPVSRQPYKVWPAKYFARIADVLIERYGARVLLLWGPGEEHFADEVRLEMVHQALPSYPVPSLPRMAALLERADLYVGNDNGPRHFAIAVNTPTVTVFGRPFPENWTPPGQPQHRVIAHDPGCKANCTYPRCPDLRCINEVPYKGVEAQVESLLEELLKDGTTH